MPGVHLPPKEPAGAGSNLALCRRQTPPGAGTPLEGPGQRALATQLAKSLGRQELSISSSSRQTGAEEARVNTEVARTIYYIRQKVGLTQRALAKLVGTSPSVICRLEDADYRGQSLAMLNRIARALNQRIEISFVPLRKKAS